ncbi:hypothetical protein N9O56_01760 [Rickettsiales bacterium]|nr:hypothetical protein [Rickettsiales bacterium]
MGVFEKNIINFNNDYQMQQEDFFDKSSNKFYDNTKSIESKLISSFINRLTSPSYLKDTNSKGIQPVIKIISKQTGATQVRRLIDYITREAEEKDQHLEIESEEGVIYKNRDDREKILNEWREDFTSKESYQKQQWKLDILEELEEKRSKILKTSQENRTQIQKDQLEKLNDQIDNQYVLRKVKDKETGMFLQVKRDLKIRSANDSIHMLLSVGAMPNQKKATEATKKFLQDNIAANGFKYMFVKHNDTDNLHYHIIIKNKSVFGKNLRFDKADLFALRQEYARNLSIMGISRVATLRKDRLEVLKDLQNNTDKLKERDSWYQNQLKKDGHENINENDIKKTKQKDFNVFAYRANLLKQTQFLIDQTKRQINNYQGTQKKTLKEDLKYLENVKSDFTKDVPKDNIEITKNKTIDFLKKDHKNLIKSIENFNKLKSLKQDIQNKPIKDIANIIENNIQGQHRDKNEQDKKVLINKSKESIKQDKMPFLMRRRREKYLKKLMKKHLEDLKYAKDVVEIKYKDKDAIKIIKEMMKVTKQYIKSKEISK